MILEIVGIVVTVISIIVTVISILVTKKSTKIATTPPKVKVAIFVTYKPKANHLLVTPFLYVYDNTLCV